MEELIEINYRGPKSVGKFWSAVDRKRHTIRIKVKIEEFSNNIMEGASCIALSDVDPNKPDPSYLDYYY